MNTEIWQVDNYRHCERCDGPMFMTGPDAVGPIVCAECVQAIQEIGDQQTWECENCSFYLPASAYGYIPSADTGRRVCLDCHGMAVGSRAWTH